MLQVRWFLVLMLALLAACSPITERNRPGFALPDRPEDPVLPARAERIDAMATLAEPVVTIPVPASAFQPRRSDHLEQLPLRRLPVTSWSSAPLGTVLQTVTGFAGLGLVFQDDELAGRTVTVSLPAGTIREQVAAICSAGRAWCSAGGDGQRIEVAAKATFVVELPPVPSSPSSASSAVQGGGSSGDAGGRSQFGSPRTLSAANYAGMEAALKMIVSDVKLDGAGRTIVYRASLDEAAQANAYFDQVRRNNALIMTEVMIAEVTFDTTNKLGLHWDALQARIGGGLNLALGGGASPILNSAVGVSGIYDGQRLTASVLLDFLAQEGVVHSIQAPELAALSGWPVSFMAGGHRRFITQVGFPTSANSVLGGVSINNVVNNTVQTEPYAFGLNLTLKPQYYGGVVQTDVLLDISDITNVEPITTGSTIIQNPVTADRDLSSYGMVRPGQVMLLAGIRKKRTEGTAEGLPNGNWGVSTPLLTGRAVEQTELVILMRPRVIRFEQVPEVQAAPPAPRPEVVPPKPRQPTKLQPLRPQRTERSGNIDKIESKIFANRKDRNSPTLASETPAYERAAVRDPIDASGPSWIDRLPVPPGMLVLAQADGRTTSLLPPPPEKSQPAPAGTVPAASQVQSAPGNLEPLERAVELGSVEQNRQQTILVVWKNSGGLPVRPQKPDLTTDGETTVTIIDNSCSDREIAPATTCSLKVGLTAQRRGGVRAQVALQHESGIGAVAFRGTAADAMARLSTAGPAPQDLQPGSTQLQFGAIPAERVVTLSNRSDASLAISKIRLIGGAKAGMALLEDGCSMEQGLRPGESCMVVVSFVPPAVAGDVAADLVVQHSGASRQLVVSVGGKGAGDTDDPAAASATTVALPAVPASVLTGGSSSAMASGPLAGGPFAGRPAAAAFRLLGLQGARGVIEDGSGPRVVEGGPVTLGGRLWTASMAENSVTLEGGGERLVLTMAMFGSRREPGR